MSVRVLVTDGETAAALAVVRSLGRDGRTVGVLVSGRHAPAAASRWARSAHPAPDAAADPRGWQDAVRGLLGRGRFDLFLPVTEAAMMLADAIREELPARVRVLLPASEALSGMLDKVRVLERAEALGLPVLPRREPGDAADAVFPAVVKPRWSRVLGPGGVRAGTSRVVGDPTALADTAGNFTRAGLGAYVEPWISGVGHGVFLLLQDGEVRARFAHRRVREGSPLGGPSAVARSAPLDPELLEWSVALARDLGAEGPFMAEYRGEGADRVLLEVNPRYWGSLALALSCGVDFPALHLRAALGENPPGPAEWKTGVRLRNLALDVRGLLTVLRGRPRGLDLPWPGRLRSLVGLLFDPAGGMFAEPGDPAPGRAQAIRALLRGVARG